MAGVGGARGGDLVRPGALDADAAVGGHEVGVRPLGPVGVAAGAGRGALEVDEPAVASADGLQEPGEVASGPVCHGAQCAPPVGGQVVAQRRGRSCPVALLPDLDRRVRTLCLPFEG